MDRPTLREMIARKWNRDQDDIVEEQRELRDETILIVDDSRTMVHALRVFLERAGFNTISAFDGVEAVAAAREHRPDLIIMDIVMPKMNGFEATRILTRDEETAAIPIVIVSGSERPTDRVWGTKLGAKGYLAKPFRKDALMATIDDVLTELHLQREKEMVDQILSRRGQQRRTISIFETV